jgi:hypothetical protein
MVWPAFWGYRAKDGKITPILPADAQSAVKHARGKNAGSTKNLPELTPDQIKAALAELKTNKPDAGEPVYVRNGRLFTQSGEVPYQQEPAAAPYAWPIAHDVRPASQALGVRGCTDCHSASAPFNAGIVLTAFDSAADPATRAPVGNMAQVRGKTLAMDEMWAWSFARRSTFKIFAFSAAGLLALVLLRYTLLGIGGLIKRVGGR